MGKTDIGVYIGRFQPFHIGHLRVVRQALAFADYVVVAIGSAQEQGTVKNPWSWADRYSMIEASMRPSERKRVRVVTLEDMPGQNEKWVEQVRTRVEAATRSMVSGRIVSEGDPRRYTLVGCDKDASSFYLKLFKPWWKLRLIPQWRALNATDVRKSYFGEIDDDWMAAVPSGTMGYLEAWNRHCFSGFTNIAREMGF